MTNTSYRTHYNENGKSICGNSNGFFHVKTKEAWYPASNKCKRCADAIKKRTIFI